MTIKLTGFFIYLALLLLCSSLGVWQLHRADEKKQLIDLQAKHHHEENLILTPQMKSQAKAMRFENVSLTGRYDTSQQFLLDNQIQDGKVGYFVLTPFKLRDSHSGILVNRGWVALIEPRSELPDVHLTDTAEITLTGRLNHFPSVGLKLKDADIPTATKPAVIGIVNEQRLAQQLGYELFDVQLELDPHLSDGYLRHWKNIEIMQPEQHIAYAVQWFGLAMVLTILFIKFGLGKEGDNATT